MLWVARENWAWLLLAAVLGAVVSTVLTLRRMPVAEPAGPPAPADVPPPATPEPAPQVEVESQVEVEVEPTVKAKRASMLFHTAASPNFFRMGADEWFSTEDDARAAGYVRWDDPDRPRR